LNIYISRNEGDIFQIEHYVIKENRNVEKRVETKLMTTKLETEAINEEK
jgi:hypothetical protein